MAGRYPSNSEHGATNLVALVLHYRAKHAAQDAALLSLAEAVDEKLAQLKNELTGGAGEAYDSLKELQTILENGKAELDALKELAAGHVKYDAAQGLTASQQAQARENIGAVSEGEMDAAIDAAIPLAPTANVQQTATGATINISDRFGSTTATVTNGEDGATGPYYAPYWEGDVLRFTNTGNLPNPEGKNLRGPQGVQGEQGATGAKGDTGEKGDKGETGERGPRGYTFTPNLSSAGVLSFTNDGDLPNPTAISVIGPKGDKGDTGATGATGEQGPKGDKGDTGAQGPQGVTFKPSVSSSGVLSWSNDGNQPNPGAVSLKGPQGDQGPQGIQGEVGPTGPAGATGAQGEKGDKGDTGSQGPKGDQGPRGFTFIPSLSSSGVLSWTNDGQLVNPAAVSIMGPQGPKGDTGATGAQGPKGDTGDKGDTGATGPAGPQGDKGDTGDRGPEGPQGPAGPQGPEGPQGPKGDGADIDTSIFLTKADYEEGFDGGTI